MFINAYRKALTVLAKKPIMLWGLSLLSSIIIGIVMGSCSLIPIVGVAIAGVISCGMCKVYIDGLFGKKVNSDQLFAGFTGNFMRIAGGYLWMTLWMVIWCMVPVAGIVKMYSYRFTPYILITRPDVTATQALRLSKQMTKGKKGQMFLADLCFILGVVIISAILGLLASIKFIGGIFGLILFVFILLVSLFSTVFAGLYSASFYVEACRDEKKAAQAARPAEIAGAAPQE